MPDTMARHTRRKKVGARKKRTGTSAHFLKSEMFWLLVLGIIAVGVGLSARTVSLYRTVFGTQSPGMLFVGDVMLARHVETLVDEHGTQYPFKGVRDMLEQYDAVVGNFEAGIPEHHVHTPGFTFKFSVAEDIAAVLPRVGFTHLTLANNHSYDYGTEAYEHTRAVLANAGLSAGGNPQTLSLGEVLYYTLGDVEIAIIPINTIFRTPPRAEMESVIADAAQNSDLQIVSIHWGTEYELVANETQRALARALVDAGADAIVGHHPHVVQDIEEYRGAPIFYSLGNFIFDQYWNDDVQEGLTVALSFSEHEARYALLPVTSIEMRSQPRPMNRVERTQFLDTLAKRSEQTLTEPITDGAIVEIFRLTSTSEERKENSFSFLLRAQSKQTLFTGAVQVVK